jgi:parallel beta-helix repeat protein
MGGFSGRIRHQVKAGTRLRESAAPPIFYVDRAGSDAASGRTTVAPWQTLSKVNAAMLPAGANVLLKRGGIWREQLSPKTGVTYSNYSTGALPYIYGSDLVTGLVQQTDLHVWAGTVATQPKQLTVEGVRGLQVATAGSVTSSRTWSWVTGTLTVYAPTTSSTSPVLESSVRDYCADLGAANNVTFDGLAFAYAGQTGITSLSTATRPIIKNCTLTGHFVEGIYAGNTGVAQNDGQITNNTITDCGGSGLGLVGLLGGTWQIAGNTITFCSRLHDGQTGGNARQQYSAGVKVWGNAVAGGVGPMQIANNTITDCGPQFDAGTTPGSRGMGIWMDHNVAPTGRPQVTGNTVGRCNSHGVFLEKTDNHDVARNLVFSNGVVNYRGGICVESNNLPNGNSSGNRVINNTIYGGYWPLVLNWSSYGTITNNEFRNNIAFGGSQPQQLYVAAGANNDGTNSSGNMWSHNNFGPNASNMFNWGGTQYSTLATFQSAVALATNNVAGAPLLTSPPGDCTLQSGSPCVNAGEIVAPFTNGYLGSAPDLGYAEKA